MKVYLAAPLFSEAERYFNASLCAAIEDTCDVHLPQRDGPLVEKKIEQGEAAFTVSRLAYESDISAIRQCDMMVAVLDGRVIDEGVCVEMGFAKALGKFIIGLKSDSRCALPWGHNPMIDGCVDVWVRSAEELLTWVASQGDKKFSVLKR